MLFISMVLILFLVNTCFLQFCFRFLFCYLGIESKKEHILYSSGRGDEYDSNLERYESLNIWERFCSWITSLENRLYIGWFGV
jgi:hypothetical protein